MRILMTTRGSSGHVLPLAPFGQAAVRAGHEVLVSAQRQHAGNVVRTGLPHVAVDDPPPEEWMPLMGEFGALGVDEANARMVGDFFARIDTEAALPGLEAIADDFRPDVIVRESWEFAPRSSRSRAGSRSCASGSGWPRSRSCRSHWSPPVSTAAGRLGLTADPDGDRLCDTEYFTMTPELPRIPRPGPSPRGASSGRPGDLAPLPDWWLGNDDPLVYLTSAPSPPPRTFPTSPPCTGRPSTRSPGCPFGCSSRSAPPPIASRSARCRPTCTSSPGCRRTTWRRAPP